MLPPVAVMQAGKLYWFNVLWTRCCGYAWRSFVLGMGFGVVVGIGVRNQGFPTALGLNADELSKPGAIAIPISETIAAALRGAAKLDVCSLADYSCRFSPSTMRPSKRWMVLSACRA